ncbi:MAG: hypothetical protein JJE40_00135 [Vicinamibacteria bacterium]|nr:hypothetical protein [Vicinamibacteria bacterium]
MIACVLLVRWADTIATPTTALLEVAQRFSPRVAWVEPHALAIDLHGLERLFGEPRAIGEQLRRALAKAGLETHVAVASTRTAARLLAHARAGLTVVAPGAVAEALAALPIALLPCLLGDETPVQELVKELVGKNAKPRRRRGHAPVSDLLLVFRRWGLRTLGELAALPAPDLAARLGAQGPRLQALARGEDPAPLVPLVEDERFEATLALEWPIEGLEPLSFVLSRLCEPVCQHLERRGRAASILHVELKLVTRTIWARRLELPAPMKDPRTFRTLVLLDLESNPPPAAIDAVTLRVDPTPARTLQHSLLERARPQPEQVSTLVARLSALMGGRRVGRPVLVDSHRPDAFTMETFTGDDQPDVRSPESAVRSPQSGVRSPNLVPALRRYRPPVPARVRVVDGRPVQVRATRAGMAGGAIEMMAGPWRCSGEWWACDAAWDHDEWDVALSGGTICRLSRDRLKDRWFVAGVYD